MLSISQILKLYDYQVSVKFRKKPRELKMERFEVDCFEMKAEFNNESLEIILYAPFNKTEYERDMSLLHEFIHARDDLLKGYGNLRGHTRAEYRECADVELEALETYKKRPYILEMIKDLYQIKARGGTRTLE